MKNYSLTELQVDPDHVETLASIGVRTVKDVLEIDTSPVDGVPQDWFAALRVLAELLTVEGVGPAAAGHLYWANIRSVDDLARCSPALACAVIRNRCSRLGLKTALQNEKRCLALMEKAKAAAIEKISSE